MNKIMPSEWGLSLREFREWCAKTQTEVTMVEGSRGDKAEEFYFYKEEDLSAFKLTFSYRHDQIIGYKCAVYYCPYIPIIK